MLYRAECWVVKMQHIDKMSMVEMRMLKWINGYTQNDRIRNEEIHLKIRIAPIDEKMRENHLRWFGHVQTSEDSDYCNSKKERVYPS